MNVKKISKAKIAAIYANALYEAALEKNNPENVFADVRKLLSAIEADTDFAAYMANPMNGEQDKKEILSAVAGKIRLGAETLGCLEVVLENRRFAELTQILKTFEHLYYQKKDIVEVEVDSVKPLSAVQDKKLRENLEKVLGKKIAVTYAVKPEILGGLRVRYGSDMIDDTLAHKLNRLEIMMKGE